MSKKNNNIIVVAKKVGNSVGLFADSIPTIWTLSFAEANDRVNLVVTTALLVSYTFDDNDYSDRNVSFGTSNPWSAAAAYISKEAVDHATINITMEDRVTDNTKQLRELFGWIRRRSNRIKALSITNVHLPGVYYSLDSPTSLSEQGGGLGASAIKGDVTMLWRDLLSASSGKHNNPLTLNRLVISPGRCGAARGGWNRLWSALMRSSVSAGVLVCKISSLDNRPGTTFISDFLKDTMAFRKVKFYNFHLSEEGRAFTKAVGLGLKGTNYVTSLTMRRSDNFPPSSSPDHIATWLFLGGLDKNTSLDELHLSLGVGTEDADSLVTFL